MSKLIQKLRETYERPTQSLGFRASSKSAGQYVLVLALLAESDLKQKALNSCQADALLTCIEEPKKDALHKIKQSAGELPWGVWVNSCAADSLQQLAEASPDFAAFDPVKTTAALMQTENIGKIIKVDLDAKDKLLRTISQISVDAVLVDVKPDQPGLTVYDQMLYKRISLMTSKPLLVVTNPQLSEEDLRALWEAGAGGIVARADSASMKDQIGHLRQMISKLPAKRGKSSSEGSQVLLPGSGEGSQ